MELELMDWIGEDEGRDETEVYTEIECTECGKWLEPQYAAEWLCDGPCCQHVCERHVIYNQERNTRCCAKCEAVLNGK